ncbi:YchJ family protein [Nocardiopsis ansamitocini]|uniref:UPF0225 protein Nans01_45680 n=1 Tax=Nocardiopsis ansamitocini TaxID=1670832 RepID=A0A9W6PAX8_9ACTN|nr:YchJ family metal-binding protein [Nocardiopsis ansamitocini]GLU50217.1 UPF0225 protein [Nocardiopsis ansamitocini]
MPKRRTRTDPAAAPCPCGSPKVYGGCCARLHRGSAVASTAEELMRSRYSAFATGEAGYLLRTWHPRTRPQHLDLDPGLEWLGLEIVGSTGGSPFHQEGTVSFRAVYRDGQEEGELRENSRFLRADGAWTYVDALA